LLRKAAEFERRKEYQDKKALEVLELGKSALISSKTVAEPVNEEPMEEVSDKIPLNKAVDDNKRKTVAKRNKERKNKIEKKHEEELRLEKKKLHDINHIKEIIKEVKTENEECEKKKKIKEQQLKVKLEERKDGLIFGNTKIGKYKYEQQAIDFQLPEELSKRLTGIRVQQENSIRNCYESIIKRGLVQPGTDGKSSRKIKSKLRYKFIEKNFNDYHHS
jgi:hypothetical protein